MRKRIGVLIGDADAPYCKSLLDGFTEEANRLNFDLFVFTNLNNSYNNNYNEKHSRGGENIYQLINYNEIDAILFAPGTISLQGQVQELEEKIQHEFDGPVISVDYKSKYFSSILYDDVEHLKKIIYHLIDKHGLKSIAFMTGPQTNQHAVYMLNAYLEAMEERKITVDETLIFYGDFYYNMGDEVVEKLLKRKKLPQAIACANEHMAVSVYEALISKGLRIPEDIVVTGYDAYDIGIKENYKITSIVRSGKKIAERSVRKIYEILYNEKVSEETDTEPELLLRESCGCKSMAYGQPKLSQWGIVNRHSYHSYYSNYNFMIEDLVVAESPEEAFEKCSHYLKFLKGYSDFYICLNEDWLTKDDKESNYTEKLLIAMETHKGSLKTAFKRTAFLKTSMFPDINEKRDETMVYYFVPLHMNGIDFGYAVIAYEGKPSIFSECFCSWMHNINTGLLGQRSRNLLRTMYHKVEQYALRDLLTGLYSKNGFELYAPQMYEEIKTSDKNLLYIVGDINNLTAINVNYGYGWGNKVLRILAEAFENSINMMKLSGKAFRMGSDEFALLLVGDYTIEDIGKHIECILAFVEKAKDVYDLPANITVSLGGSLGFSYEERDFQDLLAEADQQMYEQKVSYRVKMQNDNLVTRIRNKASFEKEVQNTIEANRMNNSANYAFVCIEIKDFERLINVYDRDKANKVIKRLGELIDYNLTDNNIATKYFEWQYIIFMSYINEKEILNWLLDLNIYVGKFECEIYANYTFQINSGIYLCNTSQNELLVKDMIDRAYFALQTKTSAMRHHTVYDEKMRERFIREAQIIQSMDRAIDENEFQIYLQPQHYLQMQDEVLSAEALVRWVKKDGTIIYPGEFIPTFERNGIIAKLDRHIMELVCSFISRHIDEAWFGKSKIAVNVSKNNLDYRDFIFCYTQIKNKYNIPDNVIIIEFTESAVFEDYVKFKQVMKQMKNNGFICALDDFGTGSSSLNVLKELPVDVIKMDRQFFVTEENTDKQRNNILIDSVVSMVKGLGMKVVAEGIEEAEQVEFLREIGCDVIQGFIYSKPLPAIDFIDYVKNYDSALLACDE
jgi:diguanylate cyclase (GGDEF)-like protein